MLGTLASILVPLLPTAIKFAEGLFTKENSGPDKLALVRDMLRAISERFAVVTPGAPRPTDDALEGLIEAELARLKAANALTPDLAAPATTVLLIQGTVRQIPIT